MRAAVRTSPWLPIAAVIAVALTASLGIRAVQANADRFRDAEIVMGRLAEQANSMDSLEWQAIAAGRVTPDLEGDVAGARAAVADCQRRLAELGVTGQPLERIHDAYRAYTEGVDQEFRLLGLGRLPEASELDEAVVDPRFDRLHTEIQAAISWSGARADRSRRIAEMGASLLILGAGAVIGLLFWGFDRWRRSALLAAAAHRVAAQMHSERGKVLEQTVKAAEDERVRIAADLHDGPIQRLTAMTYRVELMRQRLRRGDTGHAVTLVEDLQRDLSGEIQGIRETMSSLRPPVLDHAGLERALRDHLEVVERSTGLTCALEADGTDDLDPQIQIIVYRIVQEALANAAKHGRASHVWVDLTARNGSTDLTIRDDGVGFDVSRLSRALTNGHFGIASMRERAEMAGGSFDVRSTPGGGTTIAAIVPRGGGGP